MTTTLAAGRARFVSPGSQRGYLWVVEEMACRVGARGGTSYPIERWHFCLEFDTLLKQQLYKSLAGYPPSKENAALGRHQGKPRCNPGAARMIRWRSWEGFPKGVLVCKVVLREQKLLAERTAQQPLLVDCSSAIYSIYIYIYIYTYISIRGNSGDYCERDDGNGDDCDEDCIHHTHSWSRRLSLRGSGRDAGGIAGLSLVVMFCLCVLRVMLMCFCYCYLLEEKDMLYSYMYA